MNFFTFNDKPFIDICQQKENDKYPKSVWLDEYCVKNVFEQIAKIKKHLGFSDEESSSDGENNSSDSESKKSKKKGKSSKTKLTLANNEPEIEIEISADSEQESTKKVPV